MVVMMWARGLLLLLAASSGAAASGLMESLSISLQSEMEGVREMAVVNYSELLINTTYVSRLDFDMRAMGHLYNSTPYVIDTIANKQAFPPGIIRVEAGHVEMPEEGLKAHWKELLAHYAGPVALITVAALLGVVLPIAGLFWCCCYWCRGGRRRRPYDRKYDTCLKGLLAILLIALLTLFLFGVVCAFATEAAMSAGGAGASGAARRGAQDARAFLHDAQAHVRHLLVQNYRELQDKLNAMLTSCGLTVSEQLAQLSRGVSVSRLAGLVAQLEDVQRALRHLHAGTAALRGKADQLNIALRSVKKQLLETLANCDQPQCKQLQEKHKIGQLNTEIHYSQMPDVSELLRNVSDLLMSNIRQEVADGQQVFREVQRGVQRSVDDHIPKIKAVLEDIGRQLSGVAEQVSVACHNTSAKLSAVDGAAQWLQHQASTHHHLGHLAAAAPPAALLAITLLLTWGLLCGVCGKRPDVYGASDCCNKGAGSSFLLCGTALMFIVGGAISLVIIPYFIVGIAGQRVICDPLIEPRGNRLFDAVQQLVDLEWALFKERSDPQFNLTTVIVRCHRNQTIYQVLSLHRVYDISKIEESVTSEISSAVKELGGAVPPPVAILRPAAKDRLRALARAGLSQFSFDRILDALETNLTSLSLAGLAEQLRTAARGLQARGGLQREAGGLLRAAAQLQDAQDQLLLPIANITDQLNTTATHVRDILRFNDSSFEEAISFLLHETEQAEHLLNTQGGALVRQLTEQYGAEVVSLVRRYLGRVQAASGAVGRCGPLSIALNATSAALCDNILLPVNGYWMSLSWCVLLLLPLLVVCQHLARLYRQLEPYPGPLTEAEYLYDAYADRDNVPLANAYKAEKRVRAGVAGAAAGGVGSVGGGGGGGGAAGGGGAPRRPDPRRDDAHARRYNDMAPKHWEEGPPRYGPTEYERPPPYYYPGANDRQ